MIRCLFLISGDLDGAYQKRIKEKAGRCEVTSIITSTSSNQVKLMLEGENRAVSQVFVWLLKKPRLARIRRLEGDTEILSCR